ncbi:hypothetical protein [Pseudoneobacillus sp. C159]
MDLLQDLIELESRYKNEDFKENGTYEILTGSIPVIISAPHSVTHFRNGSPKHGEFMTGVLAKLIQKKLDCYCITKTKNDLTDPNYDSEHPYKEEIIDLVTKNGIEFLIDLHIMKSEREAAIEIGTGKGRNVFHNLVYANILKSQFESNGITPVIVDEHFTGGFKNTVSSTISQRSQIPCIQVEINWGLLNLQTKENRFVEILESIISSIETIRSLI